MKWRDVATLWRILYHRIVHNNIYYIMEAEQNTPSIGVFLQAFREHKLKALFFILNKGHKSVVKNCSYST